MEWAHEWRGRRFVIRRERLEEACKKLGISDPVELSIRSMEKNKGRVRGYRDGAFRITLDTYLSRRDASRTLWHELVHVMQAEREGGFEALDARAAKEMREASLEGQNQRKRFRDRTYGGTPLEREAEALGRQAHKELPLAEAH